MADIRSLVGDVLPRGKGDPNIVWVSGEPVEAPPRKATANGEFDRAERPIIRNADGGMEVGGAFDLQDIILAQAGGGGARGGGSPPRPPAPPGQQPQPGIGHNHSVPPGLPTIVNKLHPGSYPAPPPGTQPAPNAAGPAAAAEDAAALKRTDTYTAYRKHLQELDPGNPLLNLEPVPGVPPGQIIVDGIQREVGTVIQGKLGRFVFKNYGKYPDDKTMNGEQGNGEDVRILQGGKAKAEAEADFAELSKRAMPHAVVSGQHAESQTILRLPGKDMYVGYRINKDGLPTIDINSPHTGSVRFHYK